MKTKRELKIEKLYSEIEIVKNSIHIVESKKKDCWGRMKTAEKGSDSYVRLKKLHAASLALLKKHKGHLVELEYKLQEIS